jgi:hypothetical protein
VGQVVSGALWLASAACATWIGVRPAVLVLVIGGAFIFPVTQLVLRVLGGPAGLPKGHAMNALGMQVALVAPLSMPVAGAAAVGHHEWFYPAFMVVVGAHYLPFAFLYGMGEFVALAAVLVVGGVGIGLLRPHEFTLGGWATGVLLLAFALGVALARRREETEPTAAG